MSTTENKDHSIKQTSLAWISLFTVTGTLLCCALPILLVLLGLGATMAAITSSFPFIVTLTQYKAWLFTGSAILLLVSIITYRLNNSCPADPVLAIKCGGIRTWNRNILIISSIIWVIGFVTSYLALPLIVWL